MIGPAISSMHVSGTVDVQLIPTPRDDEFDHMPVSRTRKHPPSLAFIFLLEHGVRYFQFDLAFVDFSIEKWHRFVDVFRVKVVLHNFFGRVVLNCTSCVSMCAYARVCVFACVRVFVCIYIYK